jgi:hypothetical protein
MLRKVRLAAQRLADTQAGSAESHSSDRFLTALCARTLMLSVLLVPACRASELGCGRAGSLGQEEEPEAPSHACFEPARATEAPPALGHELCGLDRVWEGCAKKDLTALRAISENKRLCPIERTLAAYAHYVLSPTPDPRSLLAVMPTDSESITWLRYGYSPSYEDPRDPVYVYSDPEIYVALENALMLLALDGNPDAVELILKGWVAHIDGEWLDAVCPVVAYDLVKRQPRLTIEIAARERVLGLVLCVMYSSTSDPDWESPMDQIRRMQFDTPEATKLRDQLVDAYFNPDPDWP